ncbi:MAG: Ig domain-containing protein [Chloroflexi bacterium]|nr:Ig domain-containing protein [Chloroflexota bacterium]
MDPNGYFHGIPKINNVSRMTEEYEFGVFVTALRLSAEDAKQGTRENRYRIAVHRDSLVELGTLPPMAILTKSPLPDGTIGRTYNVTLAACGGLPPYTWQCTSNLPPGLQLEIATGCITGVPRDRTAKATLKVKVWDARRLDVKGATDSRDLELSIFPPPKEPPPPPPPPEILTQKLPYLIEGLPHEIGMAVRYGVHPFIWTVTGKPPWLELDAEKGILRGIPPIGSRGKEVIELVVRDALQRQCPESFKGEIEIRPQIGMSINKLTILSDNLPEATFGAPYVAPIALSGGAPPYRFSVSSLPNGLTMDQAGSIRGTPIVEGTFNLDVEVTDSLDPAQRANAALSLAVESLAKPLMILTDPQLPDGRVGKTYKVVFSATGGNGVYEWAAQGELPDGLSIKEGHLSGIPSVATGANARFHVTVQSSGANPMRTEREFSIAVLERKDMPSVRSPRWLWLGLVFVASGVVKWIWNAVCWHMAQK